MRNENAEKALMLFSTSVTGKRTEVFYSVRLHVFRGLQGLYACSNPNCNHKDRKIFRKRKLPLGTFSRYQTMLVAAEVGFMN